MPSHEEHCQHTLKRYGVRGDDIHKFLDEPCRLVGQSHRDFRHDTKTIKLVGEMFGKKYGREVAQNIALDHTTADHEEIIRRDKMVLMRCPNCGGQLSEDQGKKRICKYCGYEVEVLGKLQESIESIRLPSKHTLILLIRESNDETLPIALPPLYINGPYQSGGGDRVIDNVYSEFEDKARVEFSLEHALNYYPVTVNDLRLTRYGNKTDMQIKALILESKKVSSQQIKNMLDRPEVKKLEEEVKKSTQKAEKNRKLKRKIGLFFPFLFAIGGFWFANPQIYDVSATITATLIGFMIGAFFSALLTHEIPK